MNTITFNLDGMSPSQLARLYKLLVALYRLGDAELVYDVGCANCGPLAFCEEVAKA